MDAPIRRLSAFTVRLLCPRSLIRNTIPDPRLNKIPIKITITKALANALFLKFSARMVQDRRMGALKKPRPDWERIKRPEPTVGHLEKPVSLVFRGALRDLSIEGRVINQRLTLQLIMSLPPTPHPVEVFRCAQLFIYGYLEKPVSLAFRGTQRDLSIGVGG